MARAVAGGVGWIDTAPTYGGGHSEELVGRLLKRVGSDRPLVFTKCGRHWDSPQSVRRSDLRPASIRADLDASLRRLGVDHVDLLQIHWPDPVTGTPIEESWAAMRELVREGKAEAVGVCNFDVALLERCEAVGHVDSLQTKFSLVAPGPADLLQWCAHNGTAVLAYSPMAAGLLIDSFTAADVGRLDTEDWRRTDPEFQSPRLERNLQLRDALRPIAAAHGTTVAAVALAWVLSQPGMSGAIVGASSAAQVDGWLPAQLTEQDLGAIARARIP